MLYALYGLVLFGQAVAAHAYVLPAKQILAIMVDQCGSAHTLVVSQKTVLYDPALDGGIRELAETLYYRYPDRFRSEVRTPGLEQVRVVNQDSALIVIDGKIMGETESLFDHFKDLFLYRKTGLLISRLSQLGINLQIVSLGRFNERVAYVIGAKYPDESVPQVWIDKTTFRPVRLILPPGNQDAPLKEIEYLDYTQAGNGESYPTRILFFENGTLVKMHVMDTLEINAHISDQLFDVAYLRSVNEPVAPTESTLLPTSDLDEVRRGIQSFKRTYE
jgi:hypothetical protein